MELDFSSMFGQACSAASDMLVSSLADAMWTGIRYLWPWYGFLIMLVLCTWILWEIHTRFSSISFRSKNGFTPLFNSFVGAVTYWGLQGLVFLFLTYFLGNYVYCLKWPIALHLLVYWSSSRLLNYIGFWVYQKEPGKKRWKYRKKHY